MWTYRWHRVLSACLYPIIDFLNFILNLSWEYAHYKNGWFVTGREGHPKNPPDLFFRKKSFWYSVKTNWRSRKHDE